MRCHLRFPSRCFALLFGVMLTPAATWAQGQLGDGDSLSKAYDQNVQRREDLVSGAVTAAGAADKKIAEASAKWFIWRISHASTHLNPANLTKVHKDFNDQVSKKLMEPKAQATNRAFVNLFGAELVTRMKEVLDANATGKPQVYVHACMMLQTMAKLKQDDIGAYLAGMASDPKVNDVARLHALKALKEFLPVDSLDNGGNFDLTDKKVIAKKARDIKYVDTLVKYIETPVKTDTMPADEAAAVNYVRREAIISLANAEAPAVAALKKVGKIEGGVVPTLLRVLAGNLEPAPTLQEKIEAAIGLCKMRYWNPGYNSKIKNAHFDDYQPELAVYLVGKTLDEFIGAYKADFNYFKAPGKDKMLPRFAFKVEALRFQGALTEMAANAEGSPAASNAQLLKKEATPILLSMYKYENLNNDQIFRQKVVRALRPKNGYVFKTLKTAEIPLPPLEP